MQPPTDTSIPKGAPRAQENTWSVVEDGALTKTLAITNPNSHYSLTYELATIPTSGTLTVNDSSTGAFSYNPTAKGGAMAMPRMGGCSAFGWELYIEFVGDARVFQHALRLKPEFSNDP
jgi:hypothetical protein